MGYVYALFNKSIAAPETTVVLKVGMTNNDPWTRAKELSTTGLPFPFGVVWYRHHHYPQQIEKNMHAWFEDRRIAKNREFFLFSDEGWDEELTKAFEIADEWWRESDEFIDIDTCFEDFGLNDLIKEFNAPHI